MQPHEVTNAKVSGIDFRDYPDFCDAYIESAEWKETGKELTDKELEMLSENRDFVYELVLEKIY